MLQLTVTAKAIAQAFLPGLSLLFFPPSYFSLTVVSLVASLVASLVGSLVASLVGSLVLASYIHSLNTSYSFGTSCYSSRGSSYSLSLAPSQHNLSRSPSLTLCLSTPWLPL